MKSGISLKILGASCLLIAMGIGMFQWRRQASEISPESKSKEIAINQRTRDTVKGTRLERMDRLRNLLFGENGDALKKEDFRLIKSLSAESMKELLEEVAKRPKAGCPEALVIAMLRRLGEADQATALDWEGDHGSGWFVKYPRIFIKKQLILGWAERDTPAALAKVLDPEVYSEFTVWNPNEKLGVTGVLPPMELVAKAAASDPEGTWQLLCHVHHKELGGMFFEGLDPLQAKGYALRLPEIFRDPDLPGFELIGALESDLAGNLTSDSYVEAAKQAASGWFFEEPDAALAWYLKQSPTLENSGKELGEKAGSLIGKWVAKEPDKALEWARARPTEVRGAMASDVASSITALRTYSEKDLARLGEVYSWMDENRRIGWLVQTAKSQRWHSAYSDAESSPADQIFTGLKLSVEEKAALKATLAANAGN